MTKAAHVTSSVCLVLLLLPAHESIHAFLQEILRRPHTIVPDALTKNPQPKPVNIVDLDDQRSRRNLLVEHHVSTFAGGCHDAHPRTIRSLQ